MKTYSLTIPKPCHQGWDAMIPGDGGRYCLSCAKTVTDFSVMTDEAIQQYFLHSGGQPVCGSFKNIQLERISIQLPGYFFKKRIAVWQKFLVIFLICFGSNFFSIDIVLGDSKALYAQTGVKASGNKKAKKLHARKIKKNRRQYNPQLVAPINFDHTMVCGNIRPEYVPLVPMHPPQDCTLTDETSEPQGKNNPGTNIAARRNGNGSGNKKPGKEQVPAQPAEFILPVMLRLRRRAGKKPAIR